MEYDVLLRILPDLEKIAESYGLEFGLSTMRWGVTDAAFDDNLTSLLCMQEIRRCAELTCDESVCFLSLYNTKLGYRPPPLEIPMEEFEAIGEALCRTQDEEDVSALDVIKRWYILDMNKVPNVYRLKPKSAMLENKNDWWGIEPKIVNALRKAVDVLSSGLHP